MRGFPMTDGSVIMLVVGHLRTPCGRIVQRQYREITRSDYYRLAATERDTAGRPSCRTDGGRVVYGGGGIYPDLKLANAPLAPAWLSEIRELDLPTAWAGGWVTANGPSIPSIDVLARDPVLPAAALAEFRSLAARKNVVIPADVDAELQRALVGAVAVARFGDAGYYRVVAVTDPQVKEAIAALDRASGMVKAK
jgi:carboxyl-terminal processing protease